ncbi:MAG: M28 family peptidase [Muribaculaceae bacterium]|nr:M28 family peptidase [Muribaculaceae bacterium]
MKMTLFLANMAFVAMTLSCNGRTVNTNSGSSDNGAAQQFVEFVADSAYHFLQAQCEFGPRVPQTPAHTACAQYIQSRLNQFCDTVHVQQVNVTTFDGKNLTAQNMVGVINPDATQRILLLAHWDCRPWADKDEDPTKHKESVMGANDAASGTAVILELARIMHENRPAIGVDLLLVDVEDWGDYDNEDSWALGTQAWARDFRSFMGDSYAPSFGILLDMVGAHGARFAPEYYSQYNAPSVVTLVWETAQDAGFGQFFVQDGGGGVTDDHVVVNKAGIPCIDIIDMRGDGFFDGWHTTHDTLDAIDPVTLKAVGQTLSNIIYNF